MILNPKSKELVPLIVTALERKVATSTGITSVEVMLDLDNLFHFLSSNI